MCCMEMKGLEKIQIWRGEKPSFWVGMVVTRSFNASGLVWLCYYAMGG